MPKRETVEQHLSSLHTDGMNVEQAINTFWDLYKSISNVSLRDFLSIDDVAEYVQLLVVEEDKPAMCYKKLSLNVGRCNFIVCESSLVLANTLTLYKQAYNALPHSENVFLCDSSSKVEDIELFFRRAMFNDEIGLYCMMYIENLSHNVSLEAERLYCDLWAQSNGKMKSYLVIFMSDNRRKSRHLAAL